MSTLTPKQLASLLYRFASERNLFRFIWMELELTLNFLGFICYFEGRDMEIPIDLENYIPNLYAIRDFPDTEVVKEFLATLELFKSPNSNWYPTLSKAIEARKELGLHQALDPISIIYYMCENETQLNEFLTEASSQGREYKLFSFDRSSVEEFRELLDLILIDPKLSEQFVEYSSKHITHNSVVDYQDIADLIIANKLCTSEVRDIGCGTGTNIIGIADGLGNTIGYDIVHLEDSFSWTDHGKPNLSFRVIEPFKFPDLNESVGIIILAAVCGHWGEAELEKIIAESSRILKPGGAIIVAPTRDPDSNYYWDDNMFSIFQKLRSGEFKQIL